MPADLLPEALAEAAGVARNAADAARVTAAYRDAQALGCDHSAAMGAAATEAVTVSIDRGRAFQAALAKLQADASSGLPQRMHAGVAKVLSACRARPTEAADICAAAARRMEAVIASGDGHYGKARQTSTLDAMSADGLTAWDMSNATLFYGSAAVAIREAL